MLLLSSSPESTLGVAYESNTSASLFYCPPSLSVLSPGEPNDGTN